jgi:hypothetical protein
MTPKPALKLVDQAEPTAAEALARIVPDLIAAEGNVARLKRLLDRQRRRLANERSVAFIREETVRREFGG